MSVQVYGCNHVAIEVGDIEKAVAFYEDVFGLKKLDEGEGDAFFQLGEHQFLAMFERKGMKFDESHRHFGIMVRDAAQIAEVREKLTAVPQVPPKRKSLSALALTRKNDGRAQVSATGPASCSSGSHPRAAARPVCR
jgi:catechol 2,3-dioxygenase-like lactoylglutathione lyase family enzyme